ncbi:M24 family metallopeptidase [Maritalea mediterranea]|uniref:Xaa-Pro peptidase family protein n=1 Tax=Maritalea mediterranea TaxID=2909667 RepID=A0ABS9E576_9HYPH|nr:Xaa-Pro peptidase family protein [Maritalea mediterranea]MCF4097064.1 Xaa-Pro peptidase family protein [Maritalea mediterranea]
MNEIVAEKFKRLRAEMQAQNIDLVALGPTAHTQWLLGYAPYPDERMCLLLIGKETEAFVMPALNANAVREHTDIEFFEWADDQGPFTALERALEKVAGDVKQVVLDETMRADFALNLMDKIEGATHQFTKSTVGALRMRKTEDEYKLLKLNAQIADEAQEVAAKTARPGVTENDVAEAVKEHFISRGAKPVFDIVGANENGAFPHHHTSDRVLQSGDVLVVDIGGTTKGYPSDITRMVAIDHLRDDYQEVHDVVEKAVQAALAACKPGVKASDIDKAARDVITEAGYGDYFSHRTGHGLGIEIHEEPYISASSDVVLDEGMVFSIEPGIYQPGKFGVRLEEIVYLRADGPEVLSERPRDVVISKG